MKKKYYWIAGIVIIVIVMAWFISGNSINRFFGISNWYCDELANKLDSVIEDTNNPPGRFIISGWEGVVGGVLTNVENHGYDSWIGMYDYDLTFKGKNKERN
jgi:hypothetical protein